MALRQKVWPNQRFRRKPQQCVMCVTGKEDKIIVRALHEMTFVCDGRGKCISSIVGECKTSAHTGPRERELADVSCTQCDGPPADCLLIACGDVQLPVAMPSISFGPEVITWSFVRVALMLLLLLLLLPVGLQAYHFLH